MASRQLSFGSVEISHDQVLGVGSYGKVYWAKYGQLPCAAKLLHDTMLEGGDPGIFNYAEKFEDECQFLSMIKHPNIVQYLGTYRNPQTQRLVLLMELMDESLTNFLERPTNPLPYHIQLNICHNVALALSYLHSNDIIHRDLSSNNVLLIGEGVKAKVTDFGMSKLMDMNPRKNSLTLCPGATVYMPPEALTTPPHYSSKLDCFSHGVLTIQILTRNFPEPGDAHKSVLDPKYPTGQILVHVPENERRKKDIDLIKPNHPLLPLALDCLHNRATERPSADEVCERLATLKREERYTNSVEQTRDQATLVVTLQKDLKRKDQSLHQERIAHESDNQDHTSHIQALQKELLQKDQVIQQERTAHEQETKEHNLTVSSMKKELAQKDKIIVDERIAHQCETSLIQTLQEELVKKDRSIQLVKATLRGELAQKDRILRQQKEACEDKIKDQATIIQQLQEELLLKDGLSWKDETDGESKFEATVEFEKNAVIISKLTDERRTLTWRGKQQVPATFSLTNGSVAAVHGKIAYFSSDYDVYSFTVSENKWAKLPPSQYRYFSMAVVDNKLITIGGITESYHSPTSDILTLKTGLSKSWKKVLPSIPTARALPAVAVVANTKLVIAGGVEREGGSIVVEVLNTQTLQWSTASSLPQVVLASQMVLHGGEHLYLSENDKVFLCSAKELLKSCEPTLTKSSGGGSDGVWTRLADIPHGHYSSLVSVRGQVLSLGGSKSANMAECTACVRSYNETSNSWSVVAELPFPLMGFLAAVLADSEVVIVGGFGEAANSSHCTFVIPCI